MADRALTIAGWLVVLLAVLYFAVHAAISFS